MIWRSGRPGSSSRATLQSPGLALWHRISGGFDGALMGIASFHQSELQKLCRHLQTASPFYLLPNISKVTDFAMVVPCADDVTWF